MIKKLLLLIILLILFITPVSAYYYTINFYCLSNNPIDSLTNYIGNRPQVPTTAAGTSSVFFLTNGTIEGVEVYDLSNTVTGSAEIYNYSIVINNNTEYLIDTLGISSKERRFTNTSYSIPITEGDSFEIKRINAKWATNPTGNLVGGYVLFNSTTRGYVIPIMALTSSPADNVRNYMGILPAAPATTAGQRKIYIPKSGEITKFSIYDNSSGAQAGTGEPITYGIEVNGQYQGFYIPDATLSKLALNNISARIFNWTKDATIFSPIKVTKGDFIEVFRANPVWSVNPLLNIVGGNIFVDTSDNYDNDLSNGYPLYMFSTTFNPTTDEYRYISNLLTSPSPDYSGVDETYRHIYLLKGGNLTHTSIMSYSTTAGQAEMWGAIPAQTTSNISSLERRWTKDMKLIRFGDYINGNTYYASGTSINWWYVVTWYASTKPAGMIFAGWHWIEYDLNSPQILYFWRRVS